MGQSGFQLCFWNIVAIRIPITGRMVGSDYDFFLPTVPTFLRLPCGC
jgi:hypothetical protein